VLVTVAIVALGLGAFAAGTWTERVRAAARDHEMRLVALEQRIGIGLAQQQAPAQQALPGPSAREAIAVTERVRVDVKGAPARGPQAAPVTIVAFSDFQCPYCASVNPTLDKLRAEYGGRVRVVFKHFPLPIHPRAMQAHQAAVAAQEQGKFWEMHDRIFAAQQSLDRATLVSHARELGLDVPKFERALDAAATQARIRADMAEGTRIGVQGTPTFVVNGRMFSGALPYESFKAQLEQAFDLVQSGARPRWLAAR
jgi:protein-disulfide isomerase